MDNKPLAAPFNEIFADREQAEWVLDRLHDLVVELGGSKNDTDDRFSLVVVKPKGSMALNFGNRIVLSFARKGKEIDLTLLNNPDTQALGLEAVKVYTGGDLTRYQVPLDTMRVWPPELQAIHEKTIEHLLVEKPNGNPRRENHKPEAFQALFDETARDRLLINGLTQFPEGKTNEAAPKEPTPSPTSIANKFTGFTADSFAFLRDLRQNNNKAWKTAHEERWTAGVREPMRDLVTDLGPHLKKAFDPYLSPGELETAPNAKHTLPRISKNWDATPDSQYHEYYWASFYRQGRTKLTDAQLHITIWPDLVRFGFFVGEKTDEIRRQFRGRVQQNPGAFLGLIAHLGLTDGFQIVRDDDTSEPITTITSEAELISWLDREKLNILKVVPADQVESLGPDLADEILETFRRVFPIYLWAVADDYETAVDSYLSARAESDGSIDDDPPPPPYTTTDFLNTTHLGEETLDNLRAMVADRKQVIFSGPPGTGKTFVARELGKLLTGLADPPPERLEMIQFHPAYSYEDFIEGIRPVSKTAENGHTVIDYPTIRGVFRRFCDNARKTDDPCVFIIDEINRGNIPRIFGELMLLLEYREQSVPLPYSGERFRIPGNVILIGTMNTADRSIALVDFALRRRFHFFRFAADPDLFGRWLVAQGGHAPAHVERLYRTLATEALDDVSYAIGPSLFMRPNLDEAMLKRIWQFSVMPYLEEYYIDRPEKAREWAWGGKRVQGILNGMAESDTAAPFSMGDEDYPNENDDDE